MSKNTAAPRAEPPRARRPAASGKTSQGRKSRSVRPSTRSPAPSRPRRATPGENFAPRQTAHAPTAPIAPTQGHFRENSSGSSGQPARQLNPIAPAQSYFGENFTRTKATARQTEQQPAVPTVPTAFAQSYAGGKLRGPSDCLCTNRPHRTHAGPFQGKFHRHVRRPARQSNPISPAQGCSGKNFTSPKTTAQQTAPRPRPVRRRNARHPSNHSGQTSRPGRRRNDHSSARPPRPNFLRTKAPARRSPVQTGTPLTPRPATAQRCPARRWRP